MKFGQFLLLALIIIKSYAVQSHYGVFISKSGYSVESIAKIESLYHNKFCAGLKNPDCKSNVDNIKNNPLFGGFNLANNPIINNKLGIQEVSSYNILYTSVHPLEHKAVTLSGKIIYPKIDKSKVKGIVIYFHPTIFDPDSIMKNKEHLDDIIASALYASQGYIVLIPDYNGLGHDYKNQHPYVLYPLINTQSALYMSMATRKLIDEIYGFNSHDNIKMFTVGYSEGAGYSVWFSRNVQNLSNHEFHDVLTKNHYKLVASVGMDGAYDVSKTVKNFLVDKVDINGANKYKIENQGVVNMVKPGLVAVTLDSYAYMNHLSPKPLFNPEFYQMQCAESEPFIPCTVDGKKMNISEALRYAPAKNDIQIVMPILGSAFSKSMRVHDYAESYVEDFFSMLDSKNNSILALVDYNLLNDSKFNTQMQLADIIYWNTHLPVYLLSLDKDSVVSPVNTTEAIKHTRGNFKANLVDNSLVKVNTELGVSNVDHLHAQIYLNIIAVNYLNSF